MSQKKGQDKFGRRGEEELLKFANEALPIDFPNPERLSCPTNEDLKALADRHLPPTDFDDVVDHIATCSPCFVAYRAFRKEYRSRIMRRRTGAVAVVVGTALIAGYFGHMAFSRKSRAPEQVAEAVPVKAVLDFRNNTAERSDLTAPPPVTVPPHLRLALIDIRILLPLGTEDGPYSLELRDSSGASLRRTTGTTTWDGKDETFAAQLDLRRIAPGQYTLVLQRGNSSPRRYSVIVD